MGDDGPPRRGSTNGRAAVVGQGQWERSDSRVGGGTVLGHILPLPGRCTGKGERERRESARRRRMLYGGLSKLKSYKSFLKLHIFLFVGLRLKCFNN